MLATLFYHASSSSFLIVDLYLLIPAVITQILNPIAEPVIPIWIANKEAKLEMETHPVIVKVAISEWSISFKTLQAFLSFLLINSFRFISWIK